MKKCFARNQLSAAVGVVLAAAALSTPVQAVNLSDTGLGDVAVVPYYTVRQGYDTNISVVNTSDRYVVAFKIRFRESSNSRDARDFNVFLSPNDVWVATITMGDDGNTPRIRVKDQTCTAPWRSETGDPDSRFIVDPNVPADAQGLSTYYLNFTDIDYAGGSVQHPNPDPYAQAADDGTAQPPYSPQIERSQSGYIEIIEMGVMDPDVSQLAAWAVHGDGQDCAALANVNDPANNVIEVTGSGLDCNLDTTLAVGDEATGEQAFKAELCEPLNLLKVEANMIAASRGVEVSMNVTKLANFHNPEPTDHIDDEANPYFLDIYFQPASSFPDLSFVDPVESAQLYNGVEIRETFDLSNPANAVSSLLSSTHVINEYAKGGAANAATAWVLTFPTKFFYVDEVLEDPFVEQFGEDGSCVEVNYFYYDREENFPNEPPGNVIPSPPPIDIPTSNQVCWEAQTLNFATKDSGDEPNLLGALHNYIVPLESGFDNGWMRLYFADATAIVGDSGFVYEGLPVIGFALKGLEGVDQTGYGLTAPHAFKRDIHIE